MTSSTKPTFRKLAPLLIIFSIIVLITLVVHIWWLPAESVGVMRTFMGSFFAVFGLFKVARLQSFAKAYREYDIIAKQSIGYAYTYPFIEILLAIAYFTDTLPIATNITTLIIMLVGAWGVYKKLQLNEPVMCACLGTVFGIPMTKVTLVENLIMAVMALTMLIIPVLPSSGTNTTYSSGEVHVHSGFLLVLDGVPYDLSGDQYQSYEHYPRHLSIHLHDNVGTMIHRHANEITMSDFLNSLGFTTDENCITADTGEKFCEDSTNSIKLYANQTPVPNWQSYINQDNDRLLLYHGPNNTEYIAYLQTLVSDEACIYSGTCPERGLPPYESCALDCSVAK